ncbi:hypothetical protein GCM10028807_44140 [Spirosoma daeguense]
MNQDIEKLLEKYYDGETTLAEEKELRAFFQQETVPAHLQSHAAQFRYFANARSEFPSAKSIHELATRLNAPERGLFVSLGTWGVRLAASVGLIILGFGGGLVYNQVRSSAKNGTGISFSAETAPEKSLKETLAFEQLTKTSASERIHAINQSYEINQADQEITQLLLNTLNFDDNVNVRVAACQALARFEREPSVRDGLIQSLKVQTDPNVQITLIDVLVAIKERRAVEEMQRLAQNQEALDAVRLKAEEGINNLNRDGRSPS